MYVMEIGCLLLSVLGIFGACKGKRWCLILVTVSFVCAGFHWNKDHVFYALLCVCVQYAAGMAAASQTIIIRTALSYQDLYEVSHCCVRDLWWTDAVRVWLCPILEAGCPGGIQAALHDAADRNQQGQQDAAVQYSERGKQGGFGFFVMGFSLDSNLRHWVIRCASKPRFLTLTKKNFLSVFRLICSVFWSLTSDLCAFPAWVLWAYWRIQRLGRLHPSIVWLSQSGKMRAYLTDQKENADINI